MMELADEVIIGYASPGWNLGAVVGENQ